MAEYFNTDVTLMRLLWVVLAIVPGAFFGGFIVYVAAWIIIPPASGVAPARITTTRLARSATDRQIAGVCGGLAEYLGIDSTVMRLIWVILTIVPGAIVFGVIAYLIAWFILPDATSERLPSPNPAV
jgi:phage shock protein C